MSPHACRCAAALPPEGAAPALGRPGGRRAFALLLVATLLAATASAQPATGPRVALSGTMGQQALLVIDGGNPRAVRAGDAAQGVKVLSVGAGEAQVEIAGQRRTLRVGDAPVVVGGGSVNSGASKIVLTAGSGGHFMSLGSINGQAVQFMVDTGASLVALSQIDADRMGINYKQGTPVTVRTANGDMQAHRVMLSSVRVGEVELTNIEAVVQPAALPFVLLGNSFLTRFQMRRENDLMTLERRF